MAITLEDLKNKYEDNEPRPIGRHRFFSVLVPIVEKDGEVNLLSELRSNKMKTDPGEICFPGGHVEPGESFERAAVRETCEETGIPKERIKIIGQGNILYGYANYTMYTYMGIIEYEDYLKAAPCPGEVEKLFLVPISRFQGSQGQEPVIYTEPVTVNISEDFPYDFLGIDGETYYWRIGKWDIPIYEKVDLGTDVHGTPVWGLTARIVDDIVKMMEE